MASELCLFRVNSCSGCGDIDARSCNSLIVIQYLLRFPAYNRSIELIRLDMEQWPSQHQQVHFRAGRFGAGAVQPDINRICIRFRGGFSTHLCSYSDSDNARCSLYCTVMRCNVVYYT